MKVVKLSKELVVGSRNYGYTIEHGWPIGTKGTTTKYMGWYKYKRDALKRIKELKN